MTTRMACEEKAVRYPLVLADFNKGISRKEIRARHGIGDRTMYRIVDRAAAGESLLGKAGNCICFEDHENMPANSFDNSELTIKPSRPVSLQQPPVVWRFKSCVKCGGDVCEDRANQEKRCIQCGFDQRRPKVVTA